jgi:hypothetical protein
MKAYAYTSDYCDHHRETPYETVAQGTVMVPSMRLASDLKELESVVVRVHDTCASVVAGANASRFR